MLHWYQATLARWPLPTQAVMSAILFGTGDVLAQQAVEKTGIQNYDLARTGRMALYGGCVFGPAATKWYAFLQKHINLQNKTVTVGARVLADQVIFAPCHMGVFLSSMALMEGKDPRQKLAKSYLPGLEANWMVWPAVQTVNFKVVPLEHRVLFVNIVSLGWNCFLSYLNSQKLEAGARDRRVVQEAVVLYGHFAV